MRLTAAEQTDDVIVYLVLVGLLVGALGRLAIPGPNPMPIWMTILVGLAGSLIGGLIVYYASGKRTDGGLIAAVLCSSGIVWLIERRRAGTGPRRL